MDMNNSILELSNYNEQILTDAKKAYMNQIDFIGSDEPNTFIWKNENLKWYVIQIHQHDFPKGVHLLLFATKNNLDKDELILMDRRKETDNFDVEDSIHHQEQLFKILVSDKIISDKIHPIYKSISSLSILFVNSIQQIPKNKQFLDSFREFATNEYKNSNNYLNKKTYHVIDYDKTLFFANKFDFQKIIEGVNDKDFSKSLSDCIWAYNNGRWFLSASALGSVIEHLMFLTISNYNITSSDKSIQKISKTLRSALGKRPTFTHYIKTLKLNPINMSDKQERYISSLFDLRNCVDHYTTGYTNKSMVDDLFLLLRNIYNDFFIKSMEYKTKNS